MRSTLTDCDHPCRQRPRSCQQPWGPFRVREAKAGREQRANHDRALSEHTTGLLQLSLPPRRASAGIFRATLREHLARNAVPAALAEDVVLACEEAFINALMHSGDVEGEIACSVSVADERVEVVVCDHGCGFDSATLDLSATPDPLRAHGRGLFLIHYVMDEVELSSQEGTEVRMIKFLPQAGRRAYDGARSDSQDDVRGAAHESAQTTQRAAPHAGAPHDRDPGSRFSRLALSLAREQPRRRWRILVVLVAFEAVASWAWGRCSRPNTSSACRWARASR